MSRDSEAEISDRVRSSAQSVSQRKSRSKSFVWGEFEKVDEQKAKYIHCNAVLKTKYGSTSGLQRHLKFKHSHISKIVAEKKESNPRRLSRTWIRILTDQKS